MPFNISFDFDETTQKVSNIVVTSDTKVNKSRKSKIDNDKPKVYLNTNKITLTESAIELLEAKAGDRITINYFTVSNELTIPVIGKSSVFADKESGNKLTQSNTVAFRGNQHEVLSHYGDEFEIQPFKDNMFKLVASIQEELNEKELIKDLTDTNNIDIDAEIAFLQDLPF